MLIQRVNFPPILQDNEETYLRYLGDVISSVDMDSSILFTRRHQGVGVRISPSEPQGFNIILEEVKKFHTMLGIHVAFSKSMKAGANISFQIDFGKV